MRWTHWRLCAKRSPPPGAWDAARSVYVWYAEQDQDETVFYVNFHEYHPNEETVEFAVRSSCFAPEETQIGYITLSGFTVCMAATQWAPPTAFQEGMIAPHWSKRWCIEDCEIYESKCSGISLGKYLQPSNNNKWQSWKYKDDTQTQRECVCLAQIDGWSKETVGGHMIRRCEIHDCGQTGIVGHLGCVFSRIEDCHIHDINTKRNLSGAEIGGIKLHAAIDTVICRNHIHHCTRGLWLDWQAQGTRVSQNLFHDNNLPTIGYETAPSRELVQGMGEDLFIEVSHGPTLVDNNLPLSDRAVKIACQGVALVHNLIAGGLVSVGRGTDNGAKTLPSARYTPYHLPHRTEIAGFMTFLHGDVRFYNNIFLQQPKRPVFAQLMSLMQDNFWDDGNIDVGTHRYDGYPTWEAWQREFEGYCGQGAEASDRYYMHLPVWSAGNAYLQGALPWEHEKAPFVDAASPVQLVLRECDGAWFLDTNLYDYLPEQAAGCIDTERLGMAFEPEERFENPDGSPIVFDTDYQGVQREAFIAGPFAKAPGSTPLWPRQA